MNLRIIPPVDITAVNKQREPSLRKPACCNVCHIKLQCVESCCSALQCGALSCIVLHSGSVCCSISLLFENLCVLQCVAVYCSAAVQCSTFHHAAVSGSASKVLHSTYTCTLTQAHKLCTHNTHEHTHARTHTNTVHSHTYTPTHTHTHTHIHTHTHTHIFTSANNIPCSCRALFRTLQQHVA